ncbi:DUF7544 domain-containing protein [Haloarchaeobius sp. HRN-SO-5]|uniref:DUF7544 domain-containing protein n=1 Tax=Haloarchaeobius sp. HRN-SO-5 TaxID=3446118 RepID=UPI003EBDB178
MALHALEDIDDALDATRNLLTPVDRTTWVKLAVVVFFIGLPGVNGGSSGYSFGGGDANGGAPPGQPPLEPSGQTWLVIGGIVLFLLLLALAFLLVGSIMEFVFVESLRTEEVWIRKYWNWHWRLGVRLFGFRLVLGVVTFGSALLLVLPLLLAGFGGGPVGGGLAVGVFVVLLPLFLVLTLIVGVVSGFTTVFVVPIMILEDVNVLPAWRQLWGSIKRDWTQYLAYAVVGFVLALVGGMLVALLTGVAALVLLIPFGVLAAIGVGLFLLFEPLGVAAFVVLAILFGLAVLAVAALVQVPVQTYLRYYALLVLGDVDSEFDVIPRQRAAIRSDGDDENADAAV